MQQNSTIPKISEAFGIKQQNIVGFNRRPWNVNPQLQSASAIKHTSQMQAHLLTAQTITVQAQLLQL